MISGHLCCLYLSLEWKQWAPQDTSRHLFQVCATLSGEFPHTNRCCLRWAAGFAHLTVQDFSKKRRFLSFVYGKPLSIITFVWYASNVMIMTKRQAGRASFLISWVKRCFQVLDNMARLNSFFFHFCEHCQSFQNWQIKHCSVKELSGAKFHMSQILRN